MDIALATFAPGSEIVKDKRLYKSVGFIDFESNSGKIDIKDGLQKYKDKILYTCSVCGYTEVRDEHITNECCPICAHPFNKNRNEICYDICSPRGYCVDFEETKNKPQDFNGSFDWNPVQINTKIDDGTHQAIELKSVDKTNIYIGNNQIPEKGVVRTINTNNGSLFMIQKSQYNGWVVPSLAKVNTSGQSERKIALVTTKVTGILEVGLNKSNSAICVNPLNSKKEERAAMIQSAYLSWGELLRKCIADFLDIETGELSVDYCLRKDQDKSEPYPIVYMIEQLENGAGYTNYLASLSPKEKRKIFIAPLLPEGKLFSFLTNEVHRKCDTSCYDCLRDYYNLYKHRLLNWRLGLDLAAVANDDLFIPKYTEENSYWRSVLVKMEKVLEQNLESKIVKEERFWYIQSSKQIKIIYHPLWSDDYIDKLMPNQAGIHYVSLLDFINNAQGA
jgi:hypothetical protein